MENDPLSKALDDLLIEPNSTEREPQFILRDHVVDEIDRLKDDELNRYLRYRYMYDVYPINNIISEYWKLYPSIKSIGVPNNKTPVPKIDCTSERNDMVINISKAIFYISIFICN